MTHELIPTLAAGIPSWLLHLSQLMVAAQTALTFQVSRGHADSAASHGRQPARQLLTRIRAIPPQVWAQPLFSTFELLWQERKLERQEAAADAAQGGQPPSAPSAAQRRNTLSALAPSPFDQPLSINQRTPADGGSSLKGVGSDVEAPSTARLPFAPPPNLPHAASEDIRSRPMTYRGTGDLTVYNTLTLRRGKEHAPQGPPAPHSKAANCLPAHQSTPLPPRRRHAAHPPHHGKRPSGQLAK